MSLTNRRVSEVLGQLGVAHRHSWPATHLHLTGARSRMTVADITLAVFSFFNTLRFLAYVPQIAKAMRDQNGAQAISFGTWGLFLVSHLSAMAYAIENQGDWTMATLFFGNALGCGLIILIAAIKRAHHRRHQIEAAFAHLKPCSTADGDYYGDLSRYDLSTKS